MVVKRTSIVDRLPGDFHRGITEGWYTQRLGLIDSSDAKAKLVAAGVNKALLRYLREIIDRPEPEWTRWRAHYGLSMDDARDRWSSPEGDEAPVDMHWSPVCRPVYDRAGIVRHGKELRLKHVLSMMWKARLVIASRSTGDNAVDPLLGLTMASGVAATLQDTRIARLYRGTREAPRRAIRADRLAFPRADRWMWLSMGAEALRWFVVDVDFHEDDDRPAFKAAMRLMTRTLGMPRPGLIVTSRRGRGRHLYYFTESRTPHVEVQGKIAGVDGHAQAFRRGLERGLGFDPVVPGFIEVFPNGDKARQNMPPLPFGPNSFLCDVDGEVMERDPLDGLTLWDQRCAGRPIERLSDQDLAQMRPLVSADLTERVRGFHERKRRSLTAKAVAEPQDGSERERVARPTSGDACDDVARARRIIEDGMTRGCTNPQMFVVARLFKFTDGLAEPKAVAEMMRCVEHLIDPRVPSRTRAAYRDKARGWYRYVKHPLRGGKVGYMLRDGDWRFVAELVLGLDVPSATERKALAVFAARAIGFARWLEVDASGVFTADLSFKLMRTWVPRCKARYMVLRQAKWFVRVSGHRNFPGVHESARFEFDVPEPTGNLVEVGKDGMSMARALARHVPQDMGEALMGARNAKNLRRTVIL